MFFIMGALLSFNYQVSAQMCKTIKTIWEPDLKDFSRTGGFAFQRATRATHKISTMDKRARYVSSSPGAGGPALEMKTLRGVYNSLMDFNKSIPGMSATHVKFSVDMYIDEDYEYWTGGRLPIGIKIGPSHGSARCIGGGCMPKNQGGSSVRVNYNSEVDTDGVRRLKLAAYSYHLNRTTPIIFTKSAFVANAKPKESQFGDNFRFNRTIPYGKWVTLHLEVALNRLGKDDGYIKFRADWDGKPQDIIKAEGLRFRDEKWKIIGVYLTDKYNTTNKVSPAEQSMYFKNYRMVTCK